MRNSRLALLALVACGPLPSHAPTRGLCNDGGAMRMAVPPAVGDLVITEVMPRPKRLSAAAGQWFEIFALQDFDLNGVGLDRANDADPKPELITAPECIHLDAGSYGVFARSLEAAQNSGISALATFSFSLHPGAAADVQVVYDGEVIDRIAWDTPMPGASLQLDPSATDAAANDDPARFCNAVTPYDAATGNLGTPNAENAPCPPVAGANECLEGARVRPIVKPAAGQLVITEFLANARGVGNDSDQEWFEVANTGQTAFDLNGLTLAGASARDTIATTACTSVAPQSFALFAHSTDASLNGGLPSVDARFSFALANANGSVSVLDGPVLLDRIAWTTPAQIDGIARQLKPNQMNAIANDSDGNFCPGSARQSYGTQENVGTPKAANTCL